MKEYKISVYWPYDWKSLVLTEPEWNLILEGNEFSKNGEDYIYDGEVFLTFWWFQGGANGELIVYYDDGGTGFQGKLSDEEVIFDMM